MPKKKGDKHHLTPVDKEAIWQFWQVAGGIDETTGRRKGISVTARKFGVNVQTVSRIINEIMEQNEALPATRDARADAIARFAGRTQIKADMVLDSIKPEDLESGRIPITNKDGDILGYKSWGPNVVAKATAFGIISDKVGIALKNEEMLRADQAGGSLLMPSDIAGLRNAVSSSIKSLTLLDVQFADENKDLLTNAQEVLAEAEIIDSGRTDE
jgi:hypothetical protein